jgi:hypothetical protein
MARIRTVKPEFWTDEKVVTISPLARLVFIGLWNFVDDYGRAQCSPARLKMQILPADNADLPQLLAEISGVGLITIYDVEGVRYLEVTGFTKHQKIDKRAKSKHPAPPLSANSPQIPSLDQGREGIKEGKEDAEPSARIDNSEPDLFRRGKELLGQSAGGLIKNLLKAKKGNVALARSAIEVASTKQDPREYLGAIIRGRDGPDDARLRGDAW